MTYIILVYYIFTKDITYLSFAAIARRSIPVEKPPAFCSDLLPNFLGVSKWKYSIRIRQPCLRTPARRALRCWTHCRAWNLIPVHAEKIQKNTGAPIKVIPKPKVNISSRQVIDLLHKNVNARMIKSRPSVWPPLFSLWNGSSFWNRRHHSQVSWLDQLDCSGQSRQLTWSTWL